MSKAAAAAQLNLPSIATPAAGSPATWRRRLAGRRAELKAAYFDKPLPARLLAAHARVVDSLLTEIWHALAMPPNAALVAVGGYGRGLLFPHSDVDVLILLPDGTPTSPAMENFVGALWDCGIEPGHSVRTISECLTEAQDLTVDTSLLEARTVAGPPHLLAGLEARLRAQRDVRAFFDGKYDEQKRRHARFQEAAYNLEPNIKESPGGLRDLQMVIWLARAAGLGHSWKELAAEGIITAQEATRIAQNERVLQDLRIRLHYLAGRREDRLVFDHQIELARQLKLRSHGGMVPSDMLMRRYYLAAKAIWRFNSILLANLFARITPKREQPVRRIDADFEIVNLNLEVSDEELFERKPGKIFEAFHLLQKNTDVVGFSATTLRALSRSLPRIDRGFRDDPANRARFMEMLRAERLTWTLRRMSRYGVLGRYIPAFGRIVGQMQHDLFHVYTVDEHILMVIRNLRRFALKRFDHEYPFCSQLMQEFDRRELLYVAALFHDIAKGRGGDHSELGAHDARRFCRQHGLSKADTELVAWLVDNHLTMSATAQKQDLSNPETISAFATRVGNERNLTALYILTVADIRGTSPSVWNAWKGKLLEDLFHSTRRVLRGEIDWATTWVEGKQEIALRAFRQYVPEPGRHDEFWSRLDNAYFQRFEATEIAWHTRTLWSRISPEKPIVRARLSPIGEGLQVLIYAPDQPGLFARITTFFDRMHFDVVLAKIYTTRHGFALDTFQVLARARGHEHYQDLIRVIEAGLAERIASTAALEPPAAGRLPRMVKHFPMAPVVTVAPDRAGRYIEIAITAADRPGLLSTVARTFLKHGISLHDARVTTLGNRVEDIFVVEGAGMKDPAIVAALRDELLEKLRT